MIVNKYKGNGGGSGSGYTLPTATSSRLGGVKIGSGIDVQNDGTISVSGGSADLSAYWTSAETKTYVDEATSGITPDGDHTVLKGVGTFPSSAETGDFVSKIAYDTYSDWGEEGEFFKWATLPINIYELPTDRVFTIAKFTTANDDTVELKLSYDDGGVQWIWWYCSPYINGVRDTSAQRTLEPYNHIYSNIDLGNNNYAQINWNDTTLKLGVTDGTDGFLVATYTAIPNLELYPIIRSASVDGRYTYDGNVWVKDDMSAYWTSGETQTYVDDEISGITEDLSVLDGRVTDIEDTMAKSYVFGLSTYNPEDFTAQDIGVLNDFFESVSGNTSLAEGAYFKVYDDIFRISNYNINGDIGDFVFYNSTDNLLQSVVLSFANGEYVEGYHYNNDLDLKEEVISRAINNLKDTKVESTDVLRIVKITQSDYDDLVLDDEVDPDTLYIIISNN